MRIETRSMGERPSAGEVSVSSSCLRALPRQRSALCLCSAWAAPVIALGRKSPSYLKDCHQQFSLKKTLHASSLTRDVSLVLRSIVTNHCQVDHSLPCRPQYICQLFPVAVGATACMSWIGLSPQVRLDYWAQ